MQTSTIAQDALLSAINAHDGNLIEALESLWDVRPNHFTPTRVSMGWEDGHLVAIDFKWTRLTDEAMPSLGGLPSLKRLNIHGADVSDAGLVELECLLHLEELNLGRTQITDAGLNAVSKMSRLKHLDLSTTATTDVGLGSLGGLCDLEVLYLDFCREVTDRGIGLLHTLPRLRLLHLHCTQVTETGVDRLVRMLPGCEVIR